MFDCAPAKVQLVVLEFWEPDAEQGQKMMTASEDNDLAALEKLLLRPLNPNLTDKDSRTPLHSAARAGHVKAMELLLEGGAKRMRWMQEKGSRPCMKQLDKAILMRFAC